MDILFKHIGLLDRRFNLPMQVEMIGQINPKVNRIKQTFSTMNFSFILEGGGDYLINGTTWRVAAPCVITQWPGVQVEYGPSEQWSSWNELFLIYKPETCQYCLSAGLLSAERPTWPIRDLTAVQTQLSTLFDLEQQVFSQGKADRIDHICERLIIESLIGQTQTPPNREQAIIQDICNYVDRHTADFIDFKQLAATHNMSYSSFRRHWREHMPVSPASYVTSNRLRKAKQLLLESDLSIGDIAAACGYSDPMYFSRKFLQDTGLQPRKYRRTYQQPLL